MKDFQILRYIRKWRYLILICMLLGGGIFFSFFRQKQQYSAYAVISYTNGEAKYGKTPSGADIDVTRIYSSNVVADAVEQLGMEDVGIDFVRSRISVEPVISDEELTRKEALLAEGENYEETPTEYYISFTVGNDYSEDFAKNVLSTVLSSYFTYYGERYVAQSIRSNNVRILSEGNYDYIECVDIMKQSVEDILNYLYINDQNYRASATGYSFYDLSSQYTFVRDVSIDRLYVDILSGQRTKDKAVLIEKINAEISDLNLQLEKTQEQVDGLLALMAQYNPKILEAQEYSTAQREAETSNSIILQDIYERENEDGNPSYSENTYDTLMDTYVQYNMQKFQLEKQIEEKQYILDVFTAGTAQQNAISEETLEYRIDSLAEQLNAMYQIVNLTGQEYNEYLVGRNIAVKSSINVYAHMNMKIYLALTLALFMGMGCAGAIVLGRAGDIVEYTLYIDKRTMLPSRLSCDEQIEKIAKRGALDVFTCVSLSVTNLKDINTEYGRTVGDKVLSELGTILAGISRTYGFIGYNGGNQFLCLLDNCTYDKAMFMLSSLKTAVRNLNKEKTGFTIEMTAKVAESNKQEVYQIEKLLSCTYEQEERKID